MRHAVLPVGTSCNATSTQNGVNLSCLGSSGSGDGGLIEAATRERRRQALIEKETSLVAHHRYRYETTEDWRRRPPGGIGGRLSECAAPPALK